MTVATFIPKIWEARLIANFHNTSIADVIATAPTEIKGDTIIFNKVGDIAVKDYAGAVVWDDLETPKVEVTMDQKKYWAFKVDDVDKVQAAGQLIEPHTQEAAAKA